MSNRIESAACQGVYDESAMMCREDGGAIAATGNKNPVPRSDLERNAQYYADLFKNRGDLTFEKSYWIDEDGSVTHALYDVYNPEREEAKKEYRWWQKAQGCGETKNRILNKEGMLWGPYGASDCFESSYRYVGQFARVIDLYTNRVVDPADRERRFDHNMLAFENGNAFNAVGFKDGYIRVLYMNAKKFDRSLVGAPPPPEKLDSMRIMDYGNDHATDYVDARLVSHGKYVGIAEGNPSTTGALAAFDPIWDSETQPASYSYVPDFKPGELEVFVKKGDKVNAGEKLFTIRGETYYAEAKGIIGVIDYVKLGEQMFLTVDVKEKGWLAKLF